MAETTPAYILQPPPVSSQLKVYEGGGFTTNLTLVSRDRMTVVLTHGWNSNPNEWAKSMAGLIAAHSAANPPNIVTWDWTSNAVSLCSVSTVADNAQKEVPRLGQALYDLLGSDYTQPIHYIGHSMGTVVNAYAEDYLDEQVTKGAGAWLPSSVHVTLFDEAEAGSDVTCASLIIETAILGSCSYLGAEDYKHHPLPRNFGWADNYITAFGKLQTNATNIILTDKFPDIQGWADIKPQVSAYHSYPMEWYASSILNPGDTPMGFGKSFESGGIPPFPTANTAFMQSGTGLYLGTQTMDYAGNWQAQRCGKYFNFMDPGYVTTPALPANMSVNGWTTTYQFGENNFLYIFHPTTGTQQLSPNLMRAAAVNDSSTSNAAGYAWMPLDVPADATTLAFDFMLDGDGAQDSFAVAVNGTNVFSVATSLIETGRFVSTGPMDVSEFAGQTIELFLGVVGGTSTNVTVSLQNMTFYSPLPPVANFMAMPAAGTAPLTVNFTDGSSGMITNWFWDFGDGNATNISTAGVAHNYSVPGTNTVSLIVSGPTGSNTNTQFNFVWALTLYQGWQFQYFGCLGCPQAAEDADANGTGMSNLQKYMAGLDPTNPASVFMVSQSAPATNGFTVTWSSVPGKTYQVQYADSPGGSWQEDLPDSQITAGTGETSLSYTDTTAGSATARFYRIKIIFP